MTEFTISFSVGDVLTGFSIIGVMLAAAWRVSTRICKKIDGLVSEFTILKTRVYDHLGIKE